MNSNKPTNGNGYDAQIRSFSTPPTGGDSFFGGAYPGLGQSTYSEFQQPGSYPVPYEGGGLIGAGNSAPSNPLSGINFNQIKGFVDRMGGVDGIIGTMTKVQKFVGTFQQMAPMFKVLFNSFGKGKVNSTERRLDRPYKRRRSRGKNSSNPSKYSKSTVRRRTNRR